MSEPVITVPPVFANQMPEHQRALEQLLIAGQNEVAFRRAIDDLGMNGDYKKLEYVAKAMQPQGVALAAQKQKIEASEHKLSSDFAKAGFKVSMTGLLAGPIAAGASYFGLRNRITSGIKRGFALVGIAAVVSGVASAAAHAGFGRKLKQDVIALHQDQQSFDNQQAQLIAQVQEHQYAFMNTMATRMLEQQKEFVGQGADMKLVSNAAPEAQASITASMTAKYATPPAISKTAAVELEKAAAAQTQLG